MSGPRFTSDDVRALESRSNLVVESDRVDSVRDAANHADSFIRKLDRLELKETPLAATFDPRWD